MLTEQGKLYLEYSERLVEEMSQIESRLRGELNEVKGKLKLSVPSAMATKLLVQPISDFMEMHPGALFNVSVNDNRVDLIEADIDVAIRASVLEDSGYKAKYLFNNDAVYIASPDYLSQCGTPLHAEDLTDHQCLTYNLSSRPNSWSLKEHDGTLHKIRLSPAFASDSPELILKMALERKGIAALPRWMVSQYLDEGLLQEVLTSYEGMSLPMYAVYKADSYQPFRVRAFIDHLAAYFDQLTEESRVIRKR